MPGTKLAGKPHRRKVTLAWNADDVAKVWRSVLEQGDPYKYIDLPLSNYTSASYDKVLMGGKQVGINMFMIATMAATYYGLKSLERPAY